ncbi:hypothetical protein C8R47DRAFT_1324477 [Mycena vitilis]|nr:hypothetical protein C8R47DRAFT_1324477 [Mycena vitilis]
MAAEKKQREPRGPPLRRGKACLNCRHLKIRCDGARPVCSQCTRVPKEDPCEYSDTTSRTQDLENTVYRLQTQLFELEKRAGPSNYAAHSPAATASRSAQNSPLSGTSSGESSPIFGGFISGSQSSVSSENSARAADAQTKRRRKDIPEPPLEVRHALLQSFLPHATQFGFFLHPQRFIDAVLLNLPMDDKRRPAPALLHVVYLWGAHLSDPSALLNSSEVAFLKRAQKHISSEISHEHPTHLLHTIQAQILLSTYLLRQKRFLEAEFYANGAATLALGFQLHKVRAARPCASPLIGVPVLAEIYAAPADAIEEGERIRAFWAVACLQSHLNISHPSASVSFCIFESPGAQIDTPWPLEIGDYEAGTLPPDVQEQGSIRHFLTEDSFPPSPICMLHAKACVLLYRATRLGAGWSPSLQPQELAAYTTSHVWLDHRIMGFWQALPPIYLFYPDSASARTLALTHALTAAAVIRLHRGPATVEAEAQVKCLFAARAVLDVLGDARIGDRSITHPVVGALCTLACHVLMDEVYRMQVFRTAWETAASPAEVGLVGELRAGMETMGIYTVGCPLIAYQLRQLQQQYEMM